MFPKLLATAVMGAAIASAAYADPPPAPHACQAASFRIYFEPGRSALDDQAHALIGMAARDVADCERVVITLAQGSHSNAPEQGRAVLSALLAHGVHGATSPAPASYGGEFGAPDFVEVRLAPMQRDERHAANLRQS
ncbi:MAG: hypothetical protein ACT4OF_14540 [Caulobacteraceae bacterium]